MLRTREKGISLVFETYIPKGVRSQINDECGGCGGETVNVQILMNRRAGKYDLQTMVSGSICRENGRIDDLMCGGVFLPLGTGSAVNRSAARFMRDMGEHDIARGFRGARSRGMQSTAPLELQRAS